jgi:hypothetical protein
MTGNKIYLAKSNRANPNLVSYVRQTLSKFGLEIVEYTGGLYSHDELKTCDFLVVVPDLSTDTITLGKGLYEQIQSYVSLYNKSFDEVILITEFSGGVINTNMIEHIHVRSSTDYINHSWIEVSDEDYSAPLEDVLMDISSEVHGYDENGVSMFEDPRTNARLECSEISWSDGNKFYHLIPKR